MMMRLPEPALSSVAAIAPAPLGYASCDAAFACACRVTVLTAFPARRELVGRRKLPAHPRRKLAICRLLRALAPWQLVGIVRSTACTARSPNTERARLGEEREKLRR